MILDRPDPTDILAVREYFHLSDEEMTSLRIQLPGSQQPQPSPQQQSKGKEKANTYSSVPKKRKTTEVSSGSRMEAPAPQRRRKERVPVTETWTPAVPIPNVADVPLAPREHAFISGAKIMGSNFQVSDISDVEIGAMLKLPPRFSLVFQALYVSFLERHWISAAQSSLVDRQRKQISFQIYGLVLAILNLIDLVKIEECGKEMDSLEANLTSLLDDAKNKCSSAVKEMDLAVAQLASLEGELVKMSSLQNELASLKTAVEELTRRAEISEKKSAEATEVVKRCFAEGKVEGKKEAEAEASAMFDAKRAEIIKEFKASPEFIDIRTKDFQSAVQQIVDLIKQEHPEWDLSFLYVPSPPADDDNSSLPGDGDDSAAGGES